MSHDDVTGRIRPATPADVPEILAMIRDLADYERSLHEVETTEEQLVALLFGGTPDAPGIAATTPNGAPAAYAHVVDHHDAERGTSLGAFALWFLNTSTWTGEHGIYLEDLYVRPDHRGHGHGTALLGELAATCVRYGYRRLEWSALDWNTSARGFYESLGASARTDWVPYRLDGEDLVRLAGLAGSPVSSARAATPAHG